MTVGRERTASQVMRDINIVSRRSALVHALNGFYGDRFVYAVHRAARRIQRDYECGGISAYDADKLSARAVRWADRLERLSVLRSVARSS